MHAMRAIFNVMSINPSETCSELLRSVSILEPCMHGDMYLVVHVIIYFIIYYFISIKCLISLLERGLIIEVVQGMSQALYMIFFTSCKESVMYHSIEPRRWRSQLEHSPRMRKVGC